MQLPYFLADFSPVAQPKYQGYTEGGGRGGGVRHVITYLLLKACRKKMVIFEKAQLSVSFFEIVSKFINKIDIVSKLKSVNYLN